MHWGEGQQGGISGAPTASRRETWGPDLRQVVQVQRRGSERKCRSEGDRAQRLGCGEGGDNAVLWSLGSRADGGSWLLLSKSGNPRRGRFEEDD